MKLKNSIFVRLFIMIILIMSVVYLAQYFARLAIFDRLYIEQTIQRNIDDINEAAELLDGTDYTHDDLWEILYTLDLDVSAYIISEDTMFHPFRPGDPDFELDFEDYNNQDGVYFEIYVEEIPANSVSTVFYRELDNGDILVFEQFMYGLIDANQTQTTIDRYVIIGILVIMIPFVYIYSKRFTKPLIQMNKQVAALSNLEFLDPLEIHSNDEIGELSKSINKVSIDLQNAINRLQDDIEFEQYKDKKRRELIASLSHELKTPITTMRAVIEGMRDNIGRYQDRDTYLQESLEYLKYMEDLSKDLIDAINIESKQIKLDSYPLNDLIKSTHRYTKQELQKHGHSLQIKVKECNVLCNQDMIKRVLINLINNGAKYSENESNIIITNTLYDGYTEITVRNENAHIEEKEIPKLFDAFYRVEKSRSKKTGGSGLGLFIIKTILEGHDSKYSIYNKDGGIEFTFQLKTDK